MTHLSVCGFAILVAFGLLTMHTRSSGAQEQVSAPVPQATPPPRSYQIVRYQEDWSFLRDPMRRQDSLDRIKYIPLSSYSSVRYFSIGGEFRSVSERIQNDNWSGSRLATNQINLQRYQLHLDAHVEPRLRFFFQLESGFEQGRALGPRAIDLKRLDFLNAFADFDLGSSRLPIKLRMGKQELQFGSGRLVAVREGPNVRSGFYGFRASSKLGTWGVDAFAVRPAADNQGFFDDVPLHKNQFWGVYASRSWQPGSRNLLDLYYLGLDRKSAVFNRGAGQEGRQTLGARIAARDPVSTAGRIAIPHFDVEAAYQFGSFASSGVRAWTVATEFGCMFPAIAYKPRVGLRADVASGDGKPNSSAMRTFNSLFPIGNYFGILSDTGPGPINFRDLHPNVRLFLPHDVAIDADWLIWWRQSLTDGVYGVPGNLLVPAGQSSARFVGHRPGIEARWQIDRHIYLQGDYGVFFAGPFLRQSGHARNLNYSSLWIGYKF